MTTPPDPTPGDPLPATSRIEDVLAAAQREVAQIISAAEARAAGSLEARTAELDARRTELQAWAEQIDDRARDLDARTDAFDDRSRRLDARRAELDALGATLERRRAELDDRAAELETLTAGLLASAADVQEHAVRLSSLRPLPPTRPSATAAADAPTSRPDAGDQPSGRGARAEDAVVTSRPDASPAPARDIAPDPATSSVAAPARDTASPTAAAPARDTAPSIDAAPAHDTASPTDAAPARDAAPSTDPEGSASVRPVVDADVPVADEWETVYDSGPGEPTASADTGTFVEQEPEASRRVRRPRWSAWREPAPRSAARRAHDREDSDEPRALDAPRPSTPAALRIVEDHVRDEHASGPDEVEPTRPGAIAAAPDPRPAEPQASTPVLTDTAASPGRDASSPGREGTTPTDDRTPASGSDVPSPGDRPSAGGSVEETHVDPPAKLDSARLTALSMAAEGRSREEVEAVVRDELGIIDHAALIDYVFGTSTPSSVVPSWPPLRRRSRP